MVKQTLIEIGHPARANASIATIIRSVSIFVFWRSFKHPVLHVLKTQK
ncbi:hypothetical protein [Burkholderia sp. MSMB1826]|nr:hypothetical protein [Burkholderia sp. MSMB1826]